MVALAMAERPRRHHPAGVSAGFLQALAVVLTRMGADGAGFLGDLDLPVDAPSDEYRDGARVDALLEQMAVERRDPAFGLSIARAAAVRPLGLLGHVIWLSDTIDAALDRAERLFAVASQRMRIEVHRGAREVLVRQRPRHGSARGSILTEFVFASFVLRARAATDGRFALARVEFRHAGTVGADHREVFRAPVSFAAEHDQIAFGRDQLALGLASSDRHTAIGLQTLAEQRIAHIEPVDVRETVATAIRDRMPAAASLGQLAAALGWSERSLRRALHERGTSFRQLRDHVRLQHLETELARGRAMKDIALELGFSEPSALSRAYRRWTGRARHERRG